MYNDYNSFEKECYWKWAEEKNKINNPAEIQILDENYPDCFNPFKCDMWSLGVCLNKMIGRKINDNPTSLIENKYLEHIIENNGITDCQVKKLADVRNRKG